MTGRDFGGALDNHLTPDDPPHDYTEDLTESELRDLLILWLDFASVTARDEFLAFANARKAREFSENFP